MPLLFYFAVVVWVCSCCTGNYNFDWRTDCMEWWNRLSKTSTNVW